MKFFIQSIDYKLWKIIDKGDFVPINPNTNLPKNEFEFNENDEKLMSLNSRALNMLFCALDTTEFNRVSSCETAHEAWMVLQMTHEGTSQVRESNVEILFREYELFEMKKDESITEMYKRFSNLVNELRGLGKRFENVELVKKVLRSLPEAWSMKVKAIE